MQYNLVNAAKYFFGDTPAVGGKQSNPQDQWDVHDVVSYEGLRKCDWNRTAKACLHGQDFGPFATGDWCEALNCTHITWTCKPGLKAARPCNTASDRVLYGGGALGVFGAVVTPTNESTVLQIDVTITDVYADKTAGPILLYWNPSATERVWVAVVAKECEPGRLRDIMDHASGEMLASGVDCSGAEGSRGARARSAVDLAPDTAVLLSLEETAARY